MTLMAASLGIGSCWIGAFDEQALRDPAHSTIVHYEAYDAANEPGIITKTTSSGPFSVLGKLLRVLLDKR